MSQASEAQTPFPAESYNALPDIDTAKGAITRYKDGVRILLNEISNYNMHEIFSLQPVHKHSDLRDGEVMVHKEWIYHPPFRHFQHCSPRTTTALPRGLHYKAERGKAGMIPYDYTDEELSPDALQYPDFFDAFSRTLTDLGLQDVFGLAQVSNSKFTTYSYTIYEFAIPSLRSTLFVGTNVWEEFIRSEDWKDWKKIKDEQGKVTTEWAFPRGGNGKKVLISAVEGLGTEFGNFISDFTGLMISRLSLLPHSSNSSWSNTISFDDGGNPKVCGLPALGKLAVFLKRARQLIINHSSNPSI